MNNQYCAEIIESSLQTWQAQSWQWETSLPFGALTVSQHADGYIFGIVYQINTGSDDPQRTAYAYQKTEAELRREQPQVFAFLRTISSCLTVGYIQHGIIAYQLAPHPPRIHAFVGLATIEQQKNFFSQEYFLPVLFNATASLAYCDELLFAVIKRALENKTLSYDNFVRSLEMLSCLFGNDYRRFRLLLARLEVSIRVLEDKDISVTHSVIPKDF